MKTALSSLCCLLAANFAMAADVAAPAATSVSAPPSLGRLFFSPAERRMLETRRTQPVAGEAMTGSSSLTVDGVVRRSSGRNTTWINGTPLSGNLSPQGVRVLNGGRQPASVSLQPPGAGHPVHLRVGQRYDPLNHTVREPYQDPAAQPPDPTTGQR